MNNPLGKMGGRLASRAAAAETAPAAEPVPPAAVITVPGADVVNGKRRRGAGELVSQTVRLAREDWVTMNEIKVTTGLSAQEQFMAALAMWFDHQGKGRPKGGRT